MSDPPLASWSSAPRQSCFGPIRDQGDRQSCVAFTVAALTECLLERSFTYGESAVGGEYGWGR